MSVFLFRQLTAVFIWMGVLTYLLVEMTEAEGADEERSVWAPRALLAVMIAGLAAYLAASTDPTGFLLIGIWPLGVLVLCWKRVNASAAEILRMLRDLSYGAAVTVFPFLTYHVAHGSIGFWLNDVFIRSLGVVELEHIKVRKYYEYLYLGFDGLVSGDSIPVRINGLYWCVLPMLTFVLGVALWRFLRRDEKVPSAKLLVLPILALFNSLVSLFNQVPYYLYLSCGLNVAALLWLSLLSSSRSKVSYVAAAALCGVAVYYHAGQPYTRPIPQIIRGDRHPLVQSGLARNGLLISPREANRYQQVVKVIRETTREDDPIFVFPNNAEVYFLADRRNPFRLFNPTLSLIDQDEVAAFLREFDAKQPRLVLHRKKSGYNTDLTEQLLQGILPSYKLHSEVGGFAVFQRFEGIRDSRADDTQNRPPNSEH